MSRKRIAHGVATFLHRGITFWQLRFELTDYLKVLIKLLEEIKVSFESFGLS